MTRVPILILTRSQPRSLLSIARSNSARSLMRPSLSRKKRIAQIWRCFRGFFYADLPAGVPCRSTKCSRIILCYTHLSSPSATIQSITKMLIRDPAKSYRSQWYFLYLSPELWLEWLCTYWLWNPHHFKPLVVYYTYRGRNFRDTFNGQKIKIALGASNTAPAIQRVEYFSPYRDTCLSGTDAYPNIPVVDRP